MFCIDVHTHQPVDKAVAIFNLHQSFARAKQKGYYSLGLHPWYIRENWPEDFQSMEAYAPLSSVLAIGECGLDKVCATSFALQQTVFEAHIQLANTLQKPLLIHCVRSFDEVLQQLNRAHCRVPVIFHGFNRSKALAQRLIRAGYYLSFGKALMTPAIQEVFREVPLERVFLETDHSGMDIEALYRKAAAIRQIAEDSLSLQLQKNALAVFRTTSFAI